MKISAGILLFRITREKIEVLLAHPGGPFWKNKDEGAWTIPKGETEKKEELLATAIREFREETGKQLQGNFIELIPVKQKSGKLVHAWAIEEDFDPQDLKSNSFDIEWPPKSGRMQSFPEIDKAGWFTIEEAKQKINPAQIAFLTQLHNLL